MQVPEIKLINHVRDKISQKVTYLVLGEEQKKALQTELYQIKEKLAPTESAVVEATSKLKKLQVRENELIFNLLHVVISCLLATAKYGTFENYLCGSICTNVVATLEK